MSYVMGIDGGGSTTRVVLTDAHLNVHGQGQGGSANPNVTGRDSARETIRATIVKVLNDSALAPEQIAGIGIGIAGASLADFRGWLQQVIEAILPSAQLVVSSDYEIALVGAHGARRGVLVLAGTGSLAYGVNSHGESALAGGWGYLLGDEGSGYWLAMEGLRAALRMADGRGERTSLAQPIFDALAIQQPRDIVTWLYGADTARVREIAGLAHLVLEHAAAGDRAAEQIVIAGARELALAVRTVLHRLGAEPLPIAFAGGLLSASNPLSDLLCSMLGLSGIPPQRYPPQMGAALLALERVGGMRDA